MKVSVVIPCYNSEKTLEKAVNLAKQQLSSMGYEYEFVLVNDGSKDKTLEKIRALCMEDPAVKGIEFSRNFGQHSAIMAGLGQVSGEVVLGMDDDLQTHPSQFPKLFAKLNEGYDVVYGWYPHKHHNWFRNLGSNFERWTMRILTGQPKWLHTSSFWVAKAFVCEEAAKYTGPYPPCIGTVFAGDPECSECRAGAF